MNAFSIRDIENICGIKAHTLRVWEQRYQLLCPRRKAGNHRMYDANDLKCILRITYLYNKGHKISAIARLSDQERGQLALSETDAGDSTAIFVNQLTEAAMDFDQARFEQVFHTVILHQGFERAITRVAFPFLSRIGLLWLTGNVVPAQEHFASALIAKNIHIATNGLPPIRPRQDRRGQAPDPSDGTDTSGTPDNADHTPRNVLLFTPEGEFHDISVLYMNYLMKKNGVPAVFLGRNVTLEELEYYCRQKAVSHLYFHLITHLPRIEPHRYARKLADHFPDKKIVLSGGSHAMIQEKNLPPGTRLLRNLEEMVRFSAEK